MLNSLKISNRLLLVLILLFCFHFNDSAAQTGQTQLPKNELQLPVDDHEMELKWQGDSVNNNWEPHSALLIPVKLANCPKQFYMQFDLGSPITLFYSNKIKTIKSKYPQIVQLNDSATHLINLNFEVGNKKIIAQKIFVKKFGKPEIDWQNKNSIDIIGTIGVDFIENKVAIIDYPGQKLLITNSIPASLAPQLSLGDFMFVRSSILLPAVIKGKKTMLYFDTGSSAYELLTNKETVTTLAEPNPVRVQYQVKSWDRILTAYTFSTRDSVEIAFTKMPLNKATYIEGASNSQIEQMMKMGMGGMTGNKLFLRYILVLDTKNKKFGLSTH